MARPRLPLLLLGLAALLAPALVLAPGGCARKPEPPGVLLISVDTLRADRLGVYGYPKPTSPRIDAFARDALVFERALAHASETRISMASVLTGFLPHETRADAGVLPGGLDTLAEILGRAGYATAAVVSNFVLRSEEGFAQGFQIYDDELRQTEPGTWPERTADRTTARAIELLRELRGGPFFLWVHYQDPHGPYTPPERYGSRFRDPAAAPRPLPVNSGISGHGGIPAYQVVGPERDYYHYAAQYDGEVSFVDDEIGRLLDAVRELDLEDRTLIVFTADHGESLGEHDYYFAHMEYLYDELVHVPLILKHGDRLRGRREETVQGVDVLPTVLRFAGLSPDPRLRGRDLLAPAQAERAVLAEIPLQEPPGARRVSLSEGGFRLIETRPQGALELYDLSLDPGETRNLAEAREHGTRLRALQERLGALRAEDRLALPAAPPRDLGADAREKLRSLGYVE